MHVIHAALLAASIPTVMNATWCGPRMPSTGTDASQPQDGAGPQDTSQPDATPLPDGTGEIEVEVVGPAEACTEFVVMDGQGRLALEGAPYGLKGSNVHMLLGARVTNATSAGLSPQQYDWDYFLAPYGNYLPDNYGVCAWSWVDPTRCCDDAETCRDFVESQHVARLVEAGANSARLVGLAIEIDPDGTPWVPCDRVWDAYSQRDADAGRACRMSVGDAPGRTRFFEIVREAIRMLGRHGIRTILLPGARGADQGSNNRVYAAFLGELAGALRDEPWLIAIDPFNEPLYAWNAETMDPAYKAVCPGGGLCKEAAQAISKTWFDAITSRDAHHFVTVGNGVPSLAMLGWDPWVLWDHFTSWHVYPQAPWDDAESGAGSIHASRGLAQQVHLGSLAGCGLGCPYVGTAESVPGDPSDVQRCHLGAAPFGVDAFIYMDGFYYDYQAGGARCPVGSDDGAHCQAASFARGRDANPTILREPHFYVAAQAGACPAGARFDGANCVVAHGPIGSSASFGAAPGGGQEFTYAPLAGADPCPDSAVLAPRATGQRCVVAAVPAGWSPFIAFTSHFYTDAVRCDPRRPLIFGETGFSTFPNGTDLDPANYQSPRLAGAYGTCVEPDGSPRKKSGAHGTEAEQRGFLTGEGASGWPGLFQTSLACGWQGLHWWVLGTVHWGICAEDNFGLFAFWYLKASSPPGGDPFALIPREVVADLRDVVDYTATPAGHCVEPADFRSNMARASRTAKYRFTGRVTRAGAPLPLAMVYAWDNDWAGPYFALTDGDGRYALELHSCAPRAGATFYGHTRAERDVGGECPAPSAGGVVEIPLADFQVAQLANLPTRTALNPPSQRLRTCLYADGWSTPAPP